MKRTVLSWFADVVIGNSFIDGTKGFVQVFGGMLWGGYYLYRFRLPVLHSIFGIEFLAVGFGCLVLTSIGTSQVVVCRVDGDHEKGRFPTSSTVSVAHVFVNGMGDGFLLTCLVFSIFVFGVCESSFGLGFQFLLADLTGGGVPLFAVEVFVVLVLFGCVSSGAVPEVPVGTQFYATPLL